MHPTQHCTAGVDCISDCTHSSFSFQTRLRDGVCEALLVQNWLSVMLRGQLVCSIVCAFSLRSLSYYICLILSSTPRTTAHALIVGCIPRLSLSPFTPHHPLSTRRSVQCGWKGLFHSRLHSTTPYMLNPLTFTPLSPPSLTLTHPRCLTCSLHHQLVLPIQLPSSLPLLHSSLLLLSLSRCPTSIPASCSERCTHHDRHVPSSKEAPHAQAGALLLPSFSSLRSHPMHLSTLHFPVVLLRRASNASYRSFLHFPVHIHFLRLLMMITMTSPHSYTSFQNLVLLSLSHLMV